MPNMLVNSEDHVQQLALCRRMWIVSSPARTQTSPTRTSTSSELGWATHITNERFLMPKPQLQPAAALVIMLDTNTIRHIGAAASRWPAMLSTSSSINTAVGERTARTTIEHACSHRRHERRERRDQRHGRCERLGGSNQSNL